MSATGNILSIGGDLVSARNATLRTAGFDVTAALSLEDVSHGALFPAGRRLA